MRIKSDFMLRKVVGSWLVVPIGRRVVDFNGMVSLSETGAFLLKQMEEEKTVQELLHLLVNNYEVDEQTAAADLNEFLEQLESEGILEAGGVRLLETNSREELPDSKQTYSKPEVTILEIRPEERIASQCVKNNHGVGAPSNCELSPNYKNANCSLYQNPCAQMNSQGS